MSDRPEEAKIILVTGGAGYIGSHMVLKLLENGYRPVVIDNLSTGHRRFIPSIVPFIEADLKDIEAAQRVFEEFDFEAVVHFAASALVPESMADPIKYYQNNLISTINLAKIMMEYGVKKLVFSSSCSVYGEVQVFPIIEETPMAPTNPYGHSKLMAERILMDVASRQNLFFIFLRYFNVAGAHKSGKIGEWHNPETHLIPNILLFALGNKDTFEIYGDTYPTPDGTCIRDYIHVDDICDAHIMALEAFDKNIKNENINLGTGTGFSVKEIIQRVEEITGRKIEHKISGPRLGDPARLVASNEKAKRILGWEPQKSLSEIISSAWNYMKSRK